MWKDEREETSVEENVSQNEQIVAQEENISQDVAPEKEDAPQKKQVSKKETKKLQKKCNKPNKKKTIITSVTAFVLVAVITLSTLFFLGKMDKGNYPEFGGSEITVGDTVHEVYVGTTPHKMVENGTTKYKLLVTPEDEMTYSEAINEFKEIFQLSTGIIMPLEKDNGGGFFDDATYISLGETSAFKQSGITADYQTIGSQGYQIETKGKSIFVIGKKSGILFGVYDLLNKLVDYDMYTTFNPYVKRNLKEISLPDLKIKEVPDIEYRIPVMGPQFNSKKLTHRMRYQQSGEVIIPGGQAHNILNWIVPLEEHKDTHPEWFSRDQKQLCYTARGDKEAYAAMLAEAVSNIKEVLERYPSQSAMSITQMDVGVWCECDACQALQDYYGADSASQIMFVNDVATQIQEWLDAEQGGREVQFMFFAYHKSEDAPVKQNEDGTWVAVDDKVKLKDNVSVWIAPIYEDYTISVTHENSIRIRTLMESWHAVADSYFVWAYNVYFDNYLIPYDSYASMQDLIKYFVSHNTEFLWVQGNWNLRQNTGYDQLKCYLYSKLLWNCNLNVKELISDYFDKVYYEASDVMEETFWSWRAQSEIQRDLGRSGNIYMAPKEEKYWPKRYLDTQLAKMEEAKKLIEKYQTEDPALYQDIYDSIVCETISLRYIMLELYSTSLDKQALADFKRDFKEDTNRLGFNMISEFDSMDSYLSKI